MSAHAAAAWWLEVDQSTIAVMSHASAQAAGEAERRLIAEYQPRHNRAGVIGPYIPYRPAGARGSRTGGDPARRSELLSRLRAMTAERAQRPALIEQARRDGHGWEVIASALHMTVHGVRKLHATLPEDQRHR